jgi:hypothetical protein
MKSRLYFLDNLRTFMIFLVVVLHAGIVYEPILETYWIVSDPDKSNGLGFVRLYLDIMVMFIIFFISGYFIPASVKSKTDIQFIMAKFKRIMLPWIVAVFTLIPIYKFIFLASRGMPQEAWYTYFHLFQRTGSDPSLFSNFPVMNWLWFLPVLFMFQVAYWMLSKTRVFNINISLKTGVILTVILGIVYGMIISHLELRGWYNSALLHFQRERLLMYFMVFLLGSLCYKLKVFETDHKNKRMYIWANISLTVFLAIFTATALNFFFNMIDPARNYFFVSPLVDGIAFYGSMLISMLSFLYLFIYLFRFRFNKVNPLMDELNKNAYGVYINHMAVMGVIAWMMLGVDLPLFIKYLILITFTFIITNGLVYAYRMLIKPSLPHNVAGKLAVLAAMLLTITIYAKQSKPDMDNDIIEEAVDINVQPSTGLHMAVINGDLETVKLHIAAGSDLDIVEPAGGSSPLITAALLGKTDIANALIDAGADVNFRNKEGSTPLHTAAFFCRTEIVESLLSHGADKSIRNNSGSTALESVEVPFEMVRGIYDYFGATLGPIGLELDYEQIEKTRPEIAEILSKNND